MTEIKTNQQVILGKDLQPGYYILVEANHPHENKLCLFSSLTFYCDHEPTTLIVINNPTVNWYKNTFAEWKFIPASIVNINYK